MTKAFPQFLARSKRPPYAIIYKEEIHHISKFLELSELSLSRTSYISQELSHLASSEHPLYAIIHEDCFIKTNNSILMKINIWFFISISLRYNKQKTNIKTTIKILHKQAQQIL